MAELAVITKQLDFHLEQVQDFTPTPMTVSTETWYTGYDPYTLEPVYSAKTPREKLAQRQFFFWYKPDERRNIENELRRIGRSDLISKLYAGVPMPNKGGRNFGNNRRPEFERKQWERDDSPRERNRRGQESPNGGGAYGRSDGSRAYGKSDGSRAYGKPNRNGFYGKPNGGKVNEKSNSGRNNGYGKGHSKKK